MLKIWGRISSINVQKVIFTVREIGLAHERVDAGGAFGVVDTPEYRVLNPNGLVPVIQDGDWVLWESNAIVRYLARVHAAGTLWPDDPRVAADADRWMDWQTTTLGPAMLAAFWNLIRTPAEKRDAAAVASSIAKTEAMMDILEPRFARRRYATGDAFTMGDIALACAVHRWFGLPCDNRPRSDLRRWYDDVLTRPSTAGVLTLPVV